MKLLKDLFDNNREWAKKTQEEKPGFFNQLAEQQTPEYLWIGCSDSRIPANQILGLLPGDIFVHRNVANIVMQTDLNCLSVIQFAVEVLKVKHIIVCGHYGCGGVKTALGNASNGLIDNWLREIKHIAIANHDELCHLSGEAKSDRLCELNVVEQVQHVAQTTIIQSAWARAQDLSIHGIIYSIQDGLIKDLDVTLSSADDRIDLDLYRFK
jgi:carbonic anhydrase